jgi:O-antigen/teichoic acid export membrane protein
MDAEALGLRREATLTFAAKAVLAVFGFGGVILFARELGASGLGTYYFGLALIILSTRVSAGIGTAVKKRTSESDGVPGELLWTGLLLHTVSLLIIGTVFVGVEPWLTPFVGGEANVYVLAVTVGIMGWFVVTKNAYEGLGRPSRGVWADALRMMVVFAGQVTFLGQGYGVLGLFIGYLLGTLVVTIALYPLTSITVTPTRTPELADLTTFARWSIPTQVLENLHDRLDIIVLTVFLGSSAAGVYEAAKRLTMPGVILSMSLAEPLVVKVSGLDSTGNNDAVRDSLEKAVGYAGLVAVPIMFGALAIGNPLMTTVYGGAEFSGVGIVLAVLAVYQVFHVYRFPFRSATDGIDRPETNLRVNIFTVVFNMGLSLLFVEPYGVAGVALATVLTEMVRFAYYQHLASEILEGAVLPTALSSQLLAGVAMYVCLRGLIRIPGLSAWAPTRLVILIAVGGGVYFGVLGFSDPEIRTLAKTYLKKRTII